MTIADERSVLIVYPHPDDETSISGTISMYRKKGIPVSYACLTLGQLGRSLGNPVITNREELPLLRKQELLDACKVIGIEDVRMLGLFDKTIEFEDPEKIIKIVTDLIDELNPSVIYTFLPGFAVHPDHHATGRAVIEAVRRLPADQRPKIYTRAFAHNTEEVMGKPDIVNDIRHLRDLKLAVLRAHKTQMNDLADVYEEKLAAGDDTVLAYETFYIIKFDE
ncbi:Bacillithiol biosynthesis deacetylase BshB2 OS=Ureibacillus acetophenoni OX=614649 GN=SAMN05877842_1013 PE=4 SV=1 [Ureibacillus acetophenoni]